MTTAIPASWLKEPHDKMIGEVQTRKALVVHLLEVGSRDWDSLRTHLEDYITHQIAADVLAGYTPVQQVCTVTSGPVGPAQKR